MHSHGTPRVPRAQGERVRRSTRERELRAPAERPQGAAARAERAAGPRGQGAVAQGPRGGRSLQPIRFGDFLIEKRAISEGQLLDALALHWQSRCRLGEAVVARGYLSETELLRLLSEYHALRTVDV